MAFLKVKNRAETTLDGGIDNAQVTMVVAADNFPAVNFRLTIDDEIVEVTNKAGLTFTIVRGKEGTTPAAHSDEATIELRITAGIIEELQDAIPGGFASKVRAFLDSSQSIGSGSYVKVQFNSEDFDGLNEWDINNYEFTAQATGYYFIACFIQFEDPIDQQRYSLYLKKDAAYELKGTVNSSGTGVFSLIVSGIAYLTAGQKIHAWIYQTSGQGVWLSSNRYTSAISIHRIS